MADPCPNCGDPTPGDFCPTCGQRRGQRRLSLRRMLADVIEDQLSLNATLPRTLRALFFKPGFLSCEYVAGRIQRYIPPFRLYLATSVVFFLLLSFMAGRGEGVFTIAEAEAQVDTTLSTRELILRADTTSSGAPRNRDFSRIHTGWVLLDSLGSRRARELLELPPPELGRQLSAAFLQRAPTAVFLMLPLYALLLQLLYFRRRGYYVEHFVFALHIHAFVFVLFTIMLLGGRVPWVGAPLLLWLFGYGYLALRRFYGQGRLLTAVKYGALGMLYSVVFIAGITLTALAALLLG